MRTHDHMSIVKVIGIAPGESDMLSFLSPRWRRRIRWAIVLLIMLYFASHPEVRLMVTIVDAIGLDVLLMLFGAQLLSMYADMLLPMLRGLRYCVLAPALQWLGAGTRRWPVCRTLRAGASRRLRHAAMGRRLWLRLHVTWWALVRRAAPTVRALGWTPMTEPSCTRHLPAPRAAATVAASFDSPFGSA